MKKRLLVFLFLFFSVIAIIRVGNCYPQSINVDSLENRLRKTSGAKKNNIYYVLIDNYILNSPEKAIKYANEFLRYAEKADSVYIITYCYEILGEAYYYQGNYDISLDYFKKLLDVRVKQQNETDIARAFNSLGIVYRALDDYERAIDYYKRSLEINQRLNDAHGLSSSYNNLGVLHEYLNLFAQARDYYKKSLDIELGLGDWDGISTSYLNLGGINLKLRNYNVAIDYCDKSIEICDSLGYLITLEVNYEILYGVNKEIGNIEKALFYLEKFYELKNIRINKETNSRVAELEIKYNSDKKQQEIELLRKQKRQKSILNIIVLLGIGVLGFLLVILYNISKFRKKKNLLLVHRNSEIHQQKEEIEAQRDQIESQRDEIEAQRDEIRRQKEYTESQNYQIIKQNKDITDSIEYAKHIQIALFPDKITLQKVLRKGFCLFKPKDIVSGDFYWVADIGKKSVIVVADCTGHGVPGAFMSIIGINFLNEIVFDEKYIKPNEIINQLRKKILKTLVHANQIDKSKDGMDMSLVVIDYEEMKIEYAGAYNHLYHIRDHMLHIIKADKMPIGVSEKSINSFTNHTFEIRSGDLFYMFTDGYVDQFGGPNKKKFRIGNLKELLLEMHEKDMAEQKKILHETFINWKGEQSQVDDVLAIGIEII